jgi:hypothetical protein
MAILLAGGAVGLLGLVGFLRSLWRSPTKKSSDNSYSTSLQGMLGHNYDDVGHHVDPGGHGGTDGSGH